MFEGRSVRKVECHCPGATSGVNSVFHGPDRAWNEESTLICRAFSTAAGDVCPTSPLFYLEVC